MCEKTIDIAYKGLSSEPSDKISFSLKKSLAGALNNIGFVYANQGDIPKALDYHHESLKLHEELGDKKGIAYGFNNIGFLYKKQGDIKNAFEYYHKSLKIYEEIGDKEGQAMSLNNIGVISISAGDTTKALEYHLKSLKLYKVIEDKYGMAYSLHHIGSIYKTYGDPSVTSSREASLISGINKALDYYRKSLALREEKGDKKGIASSLYCIGDIYNKQGKFKISIKYGLMSLELAQELGFPYRVEDAANLLSEVYEKQGKGIKALETYKLSIKMRDSMNNEANQKATAQQQAKYKYEKQKVLDDAKHDKLLAAEQEEKEKQQILAGATAIGLGLVVVFLIFVFNRLRVTKKQKLVIEEQKEVVEEAHQEIKDSITYAKRIQSAILPPSKLVKEYLNESFILYKPKDVVAGDFYWMEHKDGKVLFAAADCTGHGVPGAMVSVVCNNALNRSVREYGLTDPGQILDKTREIVIQEFEKSEEEVKDGMDIALCSIEDNKLKYAGANNPLWIIRNSEIIETKANKQPIGQFDKPVPYKTHSFDLEQDDSIYLFSDGYVDQFGGEKGKKFKSKAFRELLLCIQDKSMEQQQTIINEAFETWKGNLEQIDDVCVIGFRI